VCGRLRLAYCCYEELVGKLPFDAESGPGSASRTRRHVYASGSRAPDHRLGVVADREQGLGAGCERALPKRRRLADALKSELSQLGFSEPRREVFDFLRDPAGYEQRYEPRLVAELVKRATAARVDKDFVAAAAAFNRALAFRPTTPSCCARSRK